VLSNSISMSFDPDPKTTSLPMPMLPPIKENKGANGNTVHAVHEKLDKKEKQENLASKLPPCDYKNWNGTPRRLKPMGQQHQFPALAIKGTASKFHGMPPSTKETPPSTAPPPSSEMNTLPLVYNRGAKRIITVDPLPGSIFSQCPEPGGWFVVHPDWRLEPGIKGVWSL